MSDERDKDLVLAVMDSNQSYGHKRIAPEIAMNKKKVLRLMKKFGLKPKITRKGGWVKAGDIDLPEVSYNNELKNICPIRPDVAWAGDFTYIRFRGAFVYLATIYRSEEHADFLVKLGVVVSMSTKSSPWQNGYQESFYSQFKLGLGPSIASRLTAIWPRLYFNRFIIIITEEDTRR